MGIQNFPAALQDIIQQGFLEREFQFALQSRLGYRACADREIFAAGIGETMTKTRAGLKPAVTLPVSPATNTNLENGLAPQSFATEQYTIAINHYAATTDLNMVTSRVGIADQFLLNASINGEQAARSLDELARNTLFNAYFGGNTHVVTALTSPSNTVAVDDIRGFTSAFVNGVLSPVGVSTSLLAVVGSNSYSIVGVTADVPKSNSFAPSGISGVLTFSSPVLVSDGAANSPVLAVNASAIFRPNNRLSTAALQPGDVLTMSALLNAVAQLRINAVPEIDGAFNCYLDPVSARQLFADGDFRQLFQGATSANQVFKRGMVNDFLGLRFIPTTEAYVQAVPGTNSVVRRPIVCGKGALIEGDFAGMAASDVAPKDAIVSLIDGIAMVTREPIDRLQQIIAQSWYWIGGFCAPSDTTTTPATIGTASNAAFKRAVMIEHIG